MATTTTTAFPATAARTDIGLALLRLATGTIFVAHGAQKLFVYGIDGVTGAFGGMGVPFPAVTGPLTGVVELLAGLALIVGLLTRLAGFGLAITMLGAIGFVHLAAGFFAPNGVEFPLALLAATSTLALTGPGRFSLDSIIARRRSTTLAGGTSARRLDRAA